MQINMEKIKYLVGNPEILQNMPQVPVLPMFSEIMVDFLNALSRKLMTLPDIRSYVDVMSYAYWIRKSSLEAAKKNHKDYSNRLGRGVAFHIAPSNVPVNFAVSMTSSLLAGNACVIRVSNQDFQQVRLICGAINELLEAEFHNLKPYFCIIRYVHSKEITDYLSSICNLRIIWGGDRTIEEIRMSPLPPRSFDLTFADRHSIAIIDADAYLERDAKQVAKDFYTDTYYTDQNACSSPRLVVWMSQDTDSDVTETARERFWTALNDLTAKDYDMKPIQAVDKFSRFCEFSMSGNESNPRLDSGTNMRVMRISLNHLADSVMDYKGAGGYFFEYTARELTELLPVLGKQCQTISVLGVDKKQVKDFVKENGVRGVDRIVDMGQTMGLEFIWDGYRMIEAMSRVIL